MVSGGGCGFCLWRFLDFPVYIFSVMAQHSETGKVIFGDN